MRQMAMRHLLNLLLEISTLSLCPHFTAKARNQAKPDNGAWSISHPQGVLFRERVDMIYLGH